MQRNRTIDFLKGVFILFVLTLHYPMDNKGPVLTALFRFLLEFAVPGFMFLSGYVQAASYQRRKIQTPEQAYHGQFLFEKCLRFLLPYTFFYLLTQIIFRITGVHMVGIIRRGLLAAFFEYLTGGKGQGGYYFPIMIQFIFIFPIIYFCILRKGFKGLIGIFFANIAFEVLKQAYGMSESEYRLLIFRYLFMIGCGCHAFLHTSGKHALRYLIMLCSFLSGYFFIILFEYTSYGTHAKIFTMWQTTSVLTSLFIVPPFYLLIEKTKLSFKPLEILGKASFHIFLVQMLYYHYWHSTFHNYFTPLPGYFFTLITCAALGILFWLLERLIKADQKILSLLEKISKRKRGMP